MQMRTLIAVTVLLAAVALLQPAQEEQAVVPSSYSAASAGAKAAYLLLKESGYRVERWEKPPRDLPKDGSGALLILAEPLWNVDREHKLAVQRFLAKGGRVLATGVSGANLLPEGHTQRSDPMKGGWQTFQPAIPSALTRGGEIKLETWTRWEKGSFADLEAAYRHYLAADVLYENSGVPPCRNIEEARQPAIIEKNGVRVAFLGYCSVPQEGCSAGTDQVAGARAVGDCGRNGARPVVRRHP
jgi:hypothetical protein